MIVSLIVIPIKMNFYTKIFLEKRKEKEDCKIMVKNEDYFNFLKSIISCISHGDYYSVKELSNLKLEKMKKQEKEIQKDLKKIKKKEKIKFSKNIPLEEWNSKDLTTLVKYYSEYIIRKIEKTNNIQELQKETITIEEFIKNI